VPLTEGFVHYLGRRYDLAIQTFQSVLEKQPQRVGALILLGETYRSQGKWQDAIQVLNRAVTLSASEAYVPLARLAEVLALSNERDSAQEIARRLEGEWNAGLFPPTNVAIAYRGLRDLDRMFAWLEVAYKEHDYELIVLNTDPANDAIRTDRRFDDLVRRLRL
jgi:tetratricopeptide (TPR) repeat protein